MSDIKKQIRELRKMTSAGIMDCKKALEETNGDIKEAAKALRKKGIAKADGKSARETAEGVIEAYVHFNGKIGVLIEVLCETDFVAKNKEFKDFAREIAVHIAAMEPRYVDRDSVPEKDVNDEKEVYLDQMKDIDKPENIKEKIVEGKLNKFYKKHCLLEQEYYKEDGKTIEEFVKENIAKFGENITVSRFKTYKIG